jgi:hypothetical protein
LLALASGLFTALFEAGWAWAYRGYEPLGTFAINFGLALGVPPAWQMLALGLVIAAAAFGQQAFRVRMAAVAARKIG